MEMAVDRRQGQLAADFIAGWNIDEHASEEGENFIGSLGASRCGLPADIDEAYRYSLLRGVEELDMMLACAKGLRKKQKCYDPLEGRDLLSFLSKIFGLAATATLEVKSKKSKRSKKKRKRANNESHFFAADATEQQAQKKTKKDKRKRARHSNCSGDCHTEPTSSYATGEPDIEGDVTSISASIIPVLRDASDVYRMNDIPASSRAATPVVQDASAVYWINDSIPFVKAAGKPPVNSTAEKSPRDSKEPMPEKSSSLEPLSALEGSASDGTRSLTYGPQRSQNPIEVDTPQTIPPSPTNSPGKDRVMPGVDVFGEAVRAQNTQPESAGIVSDSSEKRITLRSSGQTPKRIATSQYFATPQPSSSKAKSPRPPRGTVSSLPFPNLSATQFGLIQEKLADDPFRLLVAITFLIKTAGKTAIPIFYSLVDKYPTPEALAGADTREVSGMIHHLGLSEKRAEQIQKYARIWLETQPAANIRYGVKNYPKFGDGGDVRAGEEMQPEDQDPRTSAWEIGHMTSGPYAIDSWRIFCRDVLLGRAEDYKGKGREGEFQPEWMRVLPQDKELRAYLKWLWMQEGWDWDPITGEREVLSEKLRKAVSAGQVEWDTTGQLRIVGYETGVKVEADQ